MKNYKSALIMSLMALSASMPLMAGEPGTMPVKPAEPPATPSGAPATGFPVLIVPTVIILGAAIGLAVSDNDADFSVISPAATATSQ